MSKRKSYAQDNIRASKVPKLSRKVQLKGRPVALRTCGLELFAVTQRALYVINVQDHTVTTKQEFDSFINKPVLRVVNDVPLVLPDTIGSRVLQTVNIDNVDYELRRTWLGGVQLYRGDTVLTEVKKVSYRSAIARCCLDDGLLYFSVDGVIFRFDVNSNITTRIYDVSSGQDDHYRGYIYGLAVDYRGDVLFSVEVPDDSDTEGDVGPNSYVYSISMSQPDPERGQSMNITAEYKHTCPVLCVGVDVLGSLYIIGELGLITVIEGFSENIVQTIAQELDGPIPVSDLSKLALWYMF